MFATEHFSGISSNSPIASQVIINLKHVITMNFLLQKIIVLQLVVKETYNAGSFSIVYLYAANLEPSLNNSWHFTDS